MKKKIIIISVLTLLFICGGVGIFFLFKDKGIDIERSVTGIPGCGTGNEFFTHRPVNFEDIDSITPLGNLNPSGHTFPTDHIYLNIKKGKENLPVYAPGDVWVTGLDIQEKYENGRTVMDYSVDFRPCRELRASYIHIMTLSDKLQSEFDRNYSQENCVEEETGGDRFKTCFVEADVKLSAGELVGTTGKKGQINFDLDVNDLRVDTSWVRGYTKWVRWRESYLSAVCPLDYFTLDLKAKLYSIVGDFGGVRRTVEPICGTVNQDVWGTAQGIWFLSGEKVVERARDDEHMALVHDNVDPTLGAFSIGISMEEKGLPSSAYKFEPKHAGFVNRDFDEVKPDGNTYCYVASGGYSGQHHDHTIIIKMLDDKTLRIAKLDEGSTCGSGPWKFSSNYTDFER